MSVLSERTIKRLAEVITGDAGLSPYRSRPKLVTFFNQLGLNHVYPSGGGFPPRWLFAEDCIRELNNKSAIKRVIQAAYDPRDFVGATAFDKTSQQHQPVDITRAVSYLNEMLVYDGYEVILHGRRYTLSDRNVGDIEVDVKLEEDHLSRDFIVEQIEKCRSKVGQSDYDGAITNARSLLEAVLTAIEKEFEQSPPAYDGDLQKLYKRVQGHLHLSPDHPQVSENLNRLRKKSFGTLWECNGRRKRIEGSG